MGKVIEVKSRQLEASSELKGGRQEVKDSAIEDKWVEDSERAWRVLFWFILRATLDDDDNSAALIVLMGSGLN